MSDKSDFISRFIEACGTSKASAIAELLGLRYQTVRNYLNGRLPAVPVLITISEKTFCSIDWLLTGCGKKFLDGGSRPGGTVPARQIEAIARRVFVEVINEMNVNQDTAQQKIVRLQSSELMTEKVRD